MRTIQKDFPENKGIILSKFWMCDNVQVPLRADIEKLSDTNFHIVAALDHQKDPEDYVVLLCLMSS